MPKTRDSFLTCWNRLLPAFHLPLALRERGTSHILRPRQVFGSTAFLPDLPVAFSEPAGRGVSRAPLPCHAPPCELWDAGRRPALVPPSDETVWARSARRRPASASPRPCGVFQTHSKNPRRSFYRDFFKWSRSSFYTCPKQVTTVSKLIQGPSLLFTEPRPRAFTPPPPPRPPRCRARGITVPSRGVTSPVGSPLLLNEEATSEAWDPGPAVGSARCPRLSARGHWGPGRANRRLRGTYCALRGTYRVPGSGRSPRQTETL